MYKICNVCINVFIKEIINRYAKIPDEPVHVGVPHTMDKGSSASSSESGSESESESDDSEEERNNKVKSLEKELLALQEKMRKLVEESNNKKKAKKKIKEKQKKQMTSSSSIPKPNTVTAYGNKANNISENLGKFFGCLIRPPQLKLVV